MVDHRIVEDGIPSSKWVTVGMLGLVLAVGAWLLDLGLVGGGIGTAPVTTTTTTTTTAIDTTTVLPAIVAGPAPSSGEISPVPPASSLPRAGWSPTSPSPSPAPSPAPSPGCPASGVISEHHTTYDALGRVKTDQWQNIFCGLSERGWCWAPPAITWPGEPTQTGVDVSREVCA